MPELPEVETMRRGIAAITGSRILDVRQPRSKLQAITITPPLAQFRRCARGRRIERVGRVGKRIVLELDSGDAIVLEPRMSGLVLLASPPDAAHLRLVFELERGARGPRAAGFRSARFSGSERGQPPKGGTTKRPPKGGTTKQLLFWDQRGLGVARLVSPAEFARYYGPQKVGPDALEVSAETLQERLGTSRRPIKVALLDQRALAGIGNLYASEILHRIGLHPAVPCNRLRRSQWQEIHAAMGEVLRTALRHQGSTLRDGTYRIARNEPGRYQLRHLVYQRAGQPCTRCGRGEIVRIVQAQRSTFFCPKCQRRR